MVARPSTLLMSSIRKVVVPLPQDTTERGPQRTSRTPGESCTGSSGEREAARIAACKGEAMSTPLRKKALWLSLFLAANGAAGAQEAASEVGPADPLCGPAQLSGQYECVTSVPLSEEEVRGEPGSPRSFQAVG
jgi:hypothetical protein